MVRTSTRSRRDALRGLIALGGTLAVGCSGGATPTADGGAAQRPKRANPASESESKPAPAPDAEPEPPADKRIVVYGATGRVGSRLLAEALDRGYWVTAVIHKTPLTVEHERLSTVKGDITDVLSVTKTIQGHAAVVSAVGGKAPEDDPKQSMAVRSTETLLAAARRLGPAAPRIIMVGSSTTLVDPESPDGATFLEQVHPPPGPLAARLQGHAMALQMLREVSDVKWTMATPPRSFAPGERTGTYRFGDDQPVYDDAGKDAISIEDFAAAVFDELAAGKYVGKRFTVGY